MRGDENRTEVKRKDIMRKPELLEYKFYLLNRFEDVLGNNGGLTFISWVFLEL